MRILHSGSRAHDKGGYHKSCFVGSLCSCGLLGPYQGQPADTASFPCSTWQRWREKTYQYRLEVLSGSLLGSIKLHRCTTCTFIHVRYSQYSGGHGTPYRDYAIATTKGRILDTCTLCLPVISTRSSCSYIYIWVYCAYAWICICVYEYAYVYMCLFVYTHALVYVEDQCFLRSKELIALNAGSRGL